MKFSSPLRIALALGPPLLILMAGCSGTVSTSISDSATSYPSDEQPRHDDEQAILASADEASPAYSPDEHHRQQEEAMATCMAAEGFDYEMIPYSSVGGIPTVGTYVGTSLGDPELGYFGVHDALAWHANPAGASPDDLDESAGLAYSSAFENCWSERTSLASEDANQLALDFDDPEQTERLEAFFEHLDASTEYYEFSMAWSSCLTGEGFVVDEPDPTAYRLDQWTRFQTEAESILQAGGQDNLKLGSAIESFGPVLDRETMQPYLDGFSDLAELFREEIRLSDADTQCRRDNFSVVKPLLDELSLEFFGVEFSE